MQELIADPTVLALVGAAVLAVLVLASIRRVPQGHEFTIERFGRFHRVLTPGLRFVLPLADRVGARQDMRERHFVLPVTSMLTRDRVPVDVGAAAFLQIEDAARASYEVDDLEASLRSLLSLSLRTLVGERDLDGLLAQRADLNGALMAAVDDAAAVWGVRITRVEIGELAPPASVVEAATEAQATRLRSEAEARAAEDMASARRATASADLEAARTAAEIRSSEARAEAEAGERLAEGDARAALMLSRAVHEGDARALNYLLAKRYVETLRTLAASDNGRFVVLPLENGGIAASLTGIRELAEETFADLGGAEAQAAPTGPEDSAAATPGVGVSGAVPGGDRDGSPSGARAGSPDAPVESEDDLAEAERLLADLDAPDPVAGSEAPSAGRAPVFSAGEGGAR